MFYTIFTKRSVLKQIPYSNLNYLAVVGVLVEDGPQGVDDGEAEVAGAVALRGTSPAG